LELKARDAREFLPPGVCTRCEVIEESSTHFVREATIAGADLREIITLENESKVTFFQATGPREPDGPEERAMQAQFDDEGTGYRAALLSTLKRTRELLREGRL